MTDSGVKREIRHAEHMSDSEALMWAAEQDPWLSSAMGSLFLLDSAPDFDRLIAQMSDASKTVLRLRERVVPSSGLAPPRWAIDEEFDIHDHVRRVRLPSAGGHRELLDLTAQVFADPFDRNRPLWQFVAVEGSGGNTPDAVHGALILKLHHSVSDGIGAVRLAEMYMDLERDPAAKPVAKNAAAVPETDRPEGLVDTTLSDLSHLSKRPLGIARRIAAEVAMWGADSSRMRDTASDAIAVARSVADSLNSPDPEDSGSPLWKSRSRRRRLETFDLSLAEVKTAAKERGVSINDVFVGGSVIAANTYHAEHGVDVSAFNLSFIISTRTDDTAGGNSWTPFRFSVPGEPRSIEQQLIDTRDAMEAKRETAELGSSEVVEVMSGLANLLPASALSKVGRARAATQDWATSNLRSVPFPLFVSGAEITHMYPVGPVAGTAFNLTAMSYNGSFHFGLHVDPAAVADAPNLRDHLVKAYSAIVEGGS